MHFEVNRQNFRETRVAEPEPQPLEPGQVRLAIERFAVTTNNITYAVGRRHARLLGFLPRRRSVGVAFPVMGLAEITESANPNINVGGRYFGFYPMADQVVIDAQSASGAFRDAGPHRSNHAVVYTGFRNVADDPDFRPELANEYLLLWGMFMTSFLADDYLADNNFHGAKTDPGDQCIVEDIDQPGCMPGQTRRPSCRRAHVGTQPGVRRRARTVRPGDHLRRDRPTRFVGRFRHGRHGWQWHSAHQCAQPLRRQPAVLAYPLAQPTGKTWRAKPHCRALLLRCSSPPAKARNGPKTGAPTN